MEMEAQFRILVLKRVFLGELKTLLKKLQIRVQK